MLILGFAEVIECYNIAFHTFITMISRIMLKNTLLFRSIIRRALGSATRAADAAADKLRLNRLGFIASRHC